MVSEDSGYLLSLLRSRTKAGLVGGYVQVRNCTVEGLYAVRGHGIVGTRDVKEIQPLGAGLGVAFDPVVDIVEAAAIQRVGLPCLEETVLARPGAWHVAVGSQQVG